MQKKYILFLVLSLLTGIAAAQAESSWRIGWFDWAPYQELANPDEWQEGVDGLDVEFVVALAQQLGIKTEFYQGPWQDQMEKIKQGAQDVALGATKTKEREAFALFSKPYRYEQISLFVGAHEENVPNNFTNTESFVTFLKTSTFRLGVMAGMAYADHALMAFIQDPKNANRILWAQTDQEHLVNLKEGKINGFLTDRLSARMALWQTGQGRFVEEMSWDFKIPIHLMFSKKTMTPEMLKKVNQGLEGLQDKGLLKKILTRHLFVAPLQESLSHGWFLALDWIGVLVFTLSGLLIGWRLNPSLWVFILLGAGPALGSSLLRDMILGRPRITLHSHPELIYGCVALVGLGWLLNKATVFEDVKGWLLKRSKQSYTFAIQALDGVGLGVFTITAVLVCGAQFWTPLWFMGALMAMIAGGSLVYGREYLWQGGYAIQEQFFFENAALWGVLFALFLGVNQEGIISGFFFNTILLGLLGAVVTRILAVYFGWKNLRYYLVKQSRGRHRGKKKPHPTRAVE